ncbi:MAG: hypothetical protein PHF35_03960 [Candidatus Moranbacteria bacterium]|nr:hypothetical protein [Candidatus Moranbacteria bacterium]
MKLNFLRKKWIIFATAAIVIVAAGFFAAKKTSKKTALDPSSESQNSNGNADGSSENNTNFGQENSGNSADASEEVTDDEGETITVKKGNLDPGNLRSSDDGDEFAHITTEHCNTDCEAFANKLDYFEYCEQVCGITPVKDVDDCDGKKDLEKDYCLKDLAINKKDSSICEKIDDVNVRATCRNWLTQMQIEEQMGGGGGPAEEE